MPVTYNLIASNTLSTTATSVSFSAIPNTYTDLVVRFSIRTTSSDSILIGLNTSTANFSNTMIEGNGSTVGSFRNVTSGRYIGYALTTTANTFSSGEIYLPSYTVSANKPFSVFSASEANATTAQIYAVAELWSNTAAITSLELSSGGFASGSSFFLYGIKNS